MEFKCCDNCRGKNGRHPEGWIEKYDEELKLYTVAECSCHKNWTLKNQTAKLFKHYGFDQKYLDYNPRSYAGNKSRANLNRMINYANAFSKNVNVRRALVYMYGPNGCQKTAIGNYVGRELISQGYRVRYILMNNLVGLLQDATFKEEKQLELDKLNEADLIIVDESFDKEKMRLWKSGFQISFIDTWIRDRIQSKGKGIIFISNIKPDEIEGQGLSHSIQDFVCRETKKGNTYLTFEDEYVVESGLEWGKGDDLF